MTKKTTSGLSVDEDLIRQLAGLLDETGLGEIELEEDDRKIRVAKPTTAVAAPAPAAPAVTAASPVAADAAAPEDAAAHPGSIPSPMVGVCYLAADPESPPFCSEGDQVKAGDTLLLIEAMKVFNPITAPKAGKVTKILVADGTPVEFGEPLVIVE